ncbi:MAG: aminopeptidase P family protein [Clostridia bacterium]|nr:aminopeptidase P family protein [Clostridia bacterium]
MNARVERLQNFIKEQNFYGIFITDPSNVFYFSGFTGTGGDASLLITTDASYLLTDGRYTLQASTQCPDFVLLGTSSSDLSAVRELISTTAPCKIGFENRTISYSIWKRLQLELDTVTWIEVGDDCSSFRSVKEERELAIIKNACNVSVQALRETVPYIRAGVRENEIAAELEYRMRKLGASGVSFETIVASGERSAMPHGTASSKKLQEGDAVTIDFGAMYQGYASDMTRTFFLGPPKEELRLIYQAVYAAQQAAIDQFRPGMRCCDLDGVARKILQTAGYDRYFTHSLGHGVGIQVHEGLSVGRKSQHAILPGMVFSIEPGVYVDGLGGVRIEDLVVATQDGLEVLTKDFEKTLAIL